MPQNILSGGSGRSGAFLICNRVKMGMNSMEKEVCFTAGKHIPALDGIRGVAVLLVVVYHYAGCIIQCSPDSPLLYLRGMLGVTWSGVDLFFVLSGFLITGILVDNIKAKNYYSVFYFRRACRIFPLYFLIITGFALAVRMGLPDKYPQLGWLFDDPMPIWSYLLFVQNISMADAGFFGANWLAMLWSLSVEEQFYLVFPFIVGSVSRRTLVCIMGAFIIISPILRGVAGFGAITLMPCRADTLMVGALIAVAVRNKPLFDTLVRNRNVVYVIFAALLAGAALLTKNGNLMGMLNYSWLAFLYGAFLLIPLIHPGGILATLLRLRMLRKIGLIAYGIYIYHMAVLGLTHGFLLGASPVIRTGTDALVTSAAFFLTILTAWLSYELLEKRILSFGRSMPYLSPEEGAAGTLPALAGGRI